MQTIQGLPDDALALLQVSGPHAVDFTALWAALDRPALRRRLAAGDLQELVFEAVVFCARYPNWNYVRFRSEEMPDFAASFVGAPFLRNHDLADIGSRDGVVTACWMGGAQADEMHATIKLTTAEGLRDFLAGRIDRFSVSWFRSGPALCSVCGEDWLQPHCTHLPGQSYVVAGRPVLCELVQVRPVGREISAVNVPASAGTQIIDDRLVQVLAYKEQIMTSQVTGQGTGQGTGQRAGQLNQQQAAAEIAAAAAALPAQAAPVQSAGSGPIPCAAEGEVDEVAQWQALRRDVRAELGQLRAERSRLLVEGLVEASGLPEAAQTLVRQAALGPAGLRQGESVDAGAVAQLIAAQKQALAQAAQPHVVTGLRPLTSHDLHTGLDTVQEAFDWCLGVQGGPLPPPSLRNIRDVYLAVTGDLEFYGVFAPEWSQLAAATTTTLPGLARNSLNKVVRQHYDNLATFRWYERIVDVVAHDGSTQDIDLVMIDGLANLPTVAEGAAYTEAVSSDSRESMSFGKRGVYVGITLEMFRRSDIAKMQAIPRELVKAAIRTRSAAIAAIFTAAGGAGPTMGDDGVALFHAGHGNLGTAAFSAAEWAAARKRIFSQAVPGTGGKLGLWPTFALVPIDLYDTALELFGYGSGDVGKPAAAGAAQYAGQAPNPYGESRSGDPRPIPVVVPEWTDPAAWAQIVDPRLHPVIQMAYASSPQGGAHALPEIYEVRSESAGLMFTNDTLPIKIRDWWAYGVATHVGVGKNNVA